MVSSSWGCEDLLSKGIGSVSLEEDNAGSTGGSGYSQEHSAGRIGTGFQTGGSIFNRKPATSLDGNSSLIGSLTGMSLDDDSANSGNHNGNAHGNSLGSLNSLLGSLGGNNSLGSLAGNNRSSLISDEDDVHMDDVDLQSDYSYNTAADTNMPMSTTMSGNSGTGLVVSSGMGITGSAGMGLFGDRNGGSNGFYSRMGNTFHTGTANNFNDRSASSMLGDERTSSSTFGNGSFSHDENLLRNRFGGAAPNGGFSGASSSNSFPNFESRMMVRQTSGISDDGMGNGIHHGIQNGSSMHIGMESGNGLHNGMPNGVVNNYYGVHPNMGQPPMPNLESRFHESWLGWVSRVPEVVARWMHLAFNLALLSFCVWILYCFYSTISGDIESKIQIYSEEIADQMRRCQLDWESNRCNPETRVPAMEKTCTEWEKCINQDPKQVAFRTKFSAATFGESLNSFFDELNWRTLVGIPGFLFGLTGLFNLFLWIGRRNAPSHHYGDPNYVEHGVYHGYSGGNPQLMNESLIGFPPLIGYAPNNVHPMWQQQNHQVPTRMALALADEARVVETKSK